VSLSAAGHVTRHLLVAAALLAASFWASAGEAFGPPCASHGPQALLYISQPLWARGKTPRVYGLRIEESRSLPANLQASALVAPRRTQLVDLQIRPQQDVRLEFGSGVTWNVSRATFGPPTSFSVVAIRLPLSALQLPDALHPRKVEDYSRYDPWLLEYALRDSPVALISPTYLPLGLR
jgi:hypothetical protein